MDVHALGGDDDYSGVGYVEVQHPGTHYIRQRPWHMYPRSRSVSLDFEGHSSEAEVEFLLSPSWPNSGEYQEQNHQRGHPSRLRHRHSRRFAHPDESDDSEAEPNQRRKVMFSLSQSGARNSGSSPSHTTISGGTQSSVGGSQRIITDHRYRRVHHGPHATINSNGSNVTIYNSIHIHEDSDFNTIWIKIWVVSHGLFGRGDSMNMRCTWLGLSAAHVLGSHRETPFFFKLSIGLKDVIFLSVLFLDM